MENLQWDGTERIKELLPRYLGAEKSDYVYAATKLMMLGAINRIYHPGCKFEYMVCVAGNQGTGKSTFFRFLAIKDEWFSDDLRRIDDDNVYRKLQGHWFVEMAEMLATSNARSIEEIKSFITTNNFNEHLRRYCNETRVVYRSSHKIRFRACSKLYEAGIDERTIQYLMGHSFIEMTRHYDCIYRPDSAHCTAV